MKVLTIDDHAVVRRGVQQIIRDEFQNARFGGAANADEALARVAEDDWDVVILDISLPGKSGIDLFHTLRRNKPDLPVLVLSIHPEDQYAIRMLKAGAAGYMTKETAPEELIKALNLILKGERYISSGLASVIVDGIESDSVGRRPHEMLSEREFQVLCKLSRGMSVKEIGDELELSSKTISTYRTRILDKMRMKSNVELTKYAVRQGLVQ